MEHAFTDDCIARLLDTEKDIVISGAGLMGTGIAAGLLASGDGRRIVLHDTDPKACESAPFRVAERLEALRHHGLCGEISGTTAERLSVVSRIDQIATDAVGAYIEAITEDHAAKQRLFSELLHTLSPDTLLASNTSSLNINAFMDGRRSIGSHWSNPAEFFPYVEVAGTNRTDPAIIQAWTEFLRSHAWSPVVLPRFQDGYVLNALQFSAVDEACVLLDEGVTESASAIDAAVATYAHELQSAQTPDVLCSLDPITEIAARIHGRLLGVIDRLQSEGVATPDQALTILRDGLGVRWEIMGLLRAVDMGKVDLFSVIHERLMRQSGVQNPSVRLHEMACRGQFGFDPVRGCLQGFHTHTLSSAPAKLHDLHSAFASERKQQGLVYGS